MGVRVASQARPAATQRVTEHEIPDMRSQVNWALLGLVIQRASYGYELIQRFERAYGFSIELSSHSQIYVALTSLEKRSLVERVEPAPSTARSRQPKPHYRATAEGVRCYQEWLVAQVEQERIRSRLFASQLAVLPPDRALAVLDRYERACLNVASNTPTGARGSRDESLGMGERLALEDDRLTLESRLAWIQYARMQFTAGNHRGKGTAR